MFLFLFINQKFKSPKFTQVLTKIKLEPGAMVPEMFILYHQDSLLSGQILTSSEKTTGNAVALHTTYFENTHAHIFIHISFVRLLTKILEIHFSYMTQNQPSSHTDNKHNFLRVV